MTWSPLHPGGPAGTPDSPFPVDLEALADAQSDLARTGLLIADAAVHLSHLMDASTWESAAATQFAGIADRIRRGLDETHPRFTAAAASLRTFIDEVEPLISRAGEKVEEARELEALIAAPADERTREDRSRTVEPRAADERARTRAAEDLDGLQTDFDALVEQAERAADDAAARIRAAIDDVLADSWYDDLRAIAAAHTAALIAVGVLIAVACLLTGGWVQATAGVVVAVVLLITALIEAQRGPADRAAAWAPVDELIGGITALGVMRMPRGHARPTGPAGPEHRTPRDTTSAARPDGADRLARLRRGFADADGALAGLRPAFPGRAPGAGGATAVLLRPRLADPAVRIERDPGADHRTRAHLRELLAAARCPR